MNIEINEKENVTLHLAITRRIQELEERLDMPILSQSAEQEIAQLRAIMLKLETFPA